MLFVVAPHPPIPHLCPSYRYTHTAPLVFLFSALQLFATIMDAPPPPAAAAAASAVGNNMGGKVDSVDTLAAHDVRMPYCCRFVAGLLAIYRSTVMFLFLRSIFVCFWENATAVETCSVYHQ